MRFNLIGPFEIVSDDGRVYRPGTPKVCQTLALLLTRPHEIVTAEALIHELWGDTPPRSAVTTLQTYVYHARRMLVSEDLVPAGRSLIVTSPPGYRILADDTEIDIRVFERLVAQARTELGGGHPGAALRSVRQALDLWRGPALSNHPVGDVLTGHLVHLEELRVRAFEIRIEAQEQLGLNRESIPELRKLTNDYPLNEWFHSRLIAALVGAGRRAEAMRAYQNVRRILADELGMEPSPELRQLQARLLSPAPRRVPGRVPGPPGAAAPRAGGERFAVRSGT
ncbi:MULTISPECIES: AfsR/SARP family transcriptional regulator [unclassified Streptomyces]|uniref:AfsR/SARP family transcriptional regulator n=1 Tax=unclassified Streptomyces TaxID=2593676 RepID=UPI002E2ED6B8|nr:MULTISPECIES: AfsR/SARP family transcriptional regulator [unclassified Streptomyces]WUC69085.1 AfsR/SARP family transcriptional regulator [Streptomyces sp. NBC_00539]